jgi:MFS family permease
MNSNPQSVEVRYGWVIIFASLAIHSIGLAAPNILFVALKPIAADLGTLRAVPSFAYSLMMMGAGVGGIAMGWWMDKRGIMQPVLFGAVMIALGAMLVSKADGKFDLYLANGILIGLLGKAAIIAPLIANAMRWFDRRRGLAIAIISSGQGVAGAVWPSIVRYLTDEIGWRETFFYYGIFALVTMLPLALLLRSPPKVPSEAGTGTGAEQDARVLGLAPSTVQGVLWLAVIGCCVGMSVPVVHLVSHATDLGFSRTVGASMLSVLFVAAFISRISFGMLADRIGGIKTLLIGSACQTTMLVVFALVDSQVGLYVAALLFGLGFAGIMPCYPLIIRALFPASQAGWRVATQYLFAALGMAFGGWLGGVAYDTSGSYAPAFLTGAAFGVMNFVLISLVRVRYQRFHVPTLAPA